MKLQPKEFSKEELEKLAVQTSKQTTSTAMPKSEDPVNFPVFEIPVNAKEFVYVPKHLVFGEDGVEELRMDKALTHTIKDGNRFETIRCVNGLDAAGYNGRCPICDAAEDAPWTLANLRIDEACKAQGLDPKDKENEAVKQIRSRFFSERAIKQADRSFTFPIVVFETTDATARTIVNDENGVPKYKVMWYTISEGSYAKKWEKTLEGIEDEPTHPGGRFFILNYTYDAKGEANKRDSARELQVVHKSQPKLAELALKLDAETEEWTPAKCAQTVIRNHYYDLDALEEYAAEKLEKTNLQIAQYSKKGTAISTAADEKLGIPTEEDEDLPVVTGTDVD